MASDMWRELGTAAGGDDVELVENDAVLFPDEDDQLRLGDPRVVIRLESWPRRLVRERE